MSGLSKHITTDIVLSNYVQVSGNIRSLFYRYSIIVISFFFFTLSSFNSQAQRSDPAQIDASIDQIVYAINKIRSNGCRCGRKYQNPASAVSWNNQLKQSSQDYALEMYRYKRFGHNGIDGSVVGDRVDAAGYFWQLAGENIAEGYGTFREVLEAWMESPSHCELIMDGRMTNVGVSKYGKYWTLHMAKPMPPGTKRSNVRYR